MSRVFIAALWLTVMSASLCRGDLTGTQVTGSAVLPPSTTNQFDPAVMAEPSYCGNTSSTTVTIQNSSNPAYQFCAVYTPAGTTTGAPPAVAIAAQFSGSGLIIQVSLGTQPSTTPFQLTFTDAGFAGLQLAKYTDDFLCAADGTCGVTASLSGTTLTISGQVPAAGGVFNAGFTLTVPSSTQSVTFDRAVPGFSGFSAPTVTWNPVPGAQLYTVTVQAGFIETFNSWEIPANVTSFKLPILLLPGYAQIGLWAEVNGNWSVVYGDYYPSSANLLGPFQGLTGYLGTSGRSDFIYPLNGATDVDPFKPFQWISWTGGANQDGSNLIVGTAPGASDVFNGGAIQDTQTIPPYLTGATLPVTGLQPNTKYYARLTGPVAWMTPSDISFTTGVGRARLTYPADEAQQVNVTNGVVFTCNAVPGALQYVLWLGSSPGGNDAGTSGWGQATSAWIAVAFNETYYARMWTEEASGQWVYADSRFSTYPTDVAFASFPQNGDQFATGLTFAYTGALGAIYTQLDVGWKVIPDATGYTLWVGTSPGAHDVVDTYQFSVSGNVAYVPISTTSTFLNNNSIFYVRLWTQKGSSWYSTDSVISTRAQNPANQYGENPS